MDISKTVYRRLGYFFSQKTFLLLTFGLLIVGCLGIYLFVSNLLKGGQLGDIRQNKTVEGQGNSSQEVLGIGSRGSQIYIYGGANKFVSAGMVALASSEEPAIQIGGSNLSGTAEISVYKADEQNLLDYLTHDKNYNQTKKAPDINSLQFVTTVKENIAGSYEGSRIPLPLDEAGIWYLKINAAGVSADVFVIRSNTGVVTQEGDNKFVFWGQDFKTKRSISSGTLRILNLQDSVKELQRAGFSSEGIAEASIRTDADIALIERGDDRAIVPLNLKYINTGYSYNEFVPKSKLVRYFIFTDRPLYRPGEKIYFKAVLRDDDDARYTIPSGSASVKVYSGYYYSGSQDRPLFEKNYLISADGTISGEYELPTSAKVGNYSLVVSVPNQSDRLRFWDSDWSSNTIYFDVNYFRKPEYSIDVITSDTELISGDKSTFKISSSYFSGQPLINQTIKYKIQSSNFFEYQYLRDQEYFSQDLSDDYRYIPSWSGGYVANEGTVTLDKNGEATINLDAKLNQNEGKSQVYSIEATLEDGSQSPAFARRNVLIYAGEFGIYKSDYSYGTTVNTPLRLPLALVAYRQDTTLGGIALTAKAHITQWVKYQEENKKYPSYRKEEEDLAPLTATTDGRGNATFSFTPIKVGSYNITVEATDSRGNVVSKKFYSYVSSEDYPYYLSDTSAGNNLSIVSDKQQYQPTDTARFDLYSTIPDRDIFFSLVRGRVNRFQVAHLSGNNGSVEMPLVGTDVPNIYAKAVSFADDYLDTTEMNVQVSSEGKKLLVDITPNSDSFGPGETVTVNVSTTDYSGNPVSSNVALWAVDKAIFELEDSTLGDIFQQFWKERGDTTQESHSLEGIIVDAAERGGGCFAKGTSVLMAGGGSKNIEDVRIGDYILTRGEKSSELVKAKVLGTHIAQENGYLIINGSLRITANHIVWVNGGWHEAGSIQIGDYLTGSNGQKVEVASLEWQRGDFEVYNLEIEGYHSYFAGGVWVHNQKGVARSIFKDTAYWNPSVRTDSSGRGQVSFKLPDNLTTWTLAAVGSTADTRVGQTTDEIVVTKDLIVRPIIPNILRVGDDITLASLVQNFTEAGQLFDIDLTFDSGEVEEATHSGILLGASETQQFAWNVKPTQENEKGKLVFGAKAADDKNLADIVTQEIPVWEFGFLEKRAETGEGPKTYDIKLAQDSKNEKSKIKLSLSPTIIGSLPSAMDYLIGYPYGCVEQTTSSFVPAVIAKTNSALFSEALKDKDIDDIIEKGVLKLSQQQQDSGGWPWWFSGRSDPYITAYVIEYLLEAKGLGFEVDDFVLENAEHFLKEESQDQIREDTIAKIYGLTLLGSNEGRDKITAFTNLGPDFLSLAVMANYLNGDRNPVSNGLTQLMALAQNQGDAIYWKEGSKANFGSNDASTALAIRAILLAGGDREFAAKAVRYLTRVRKFEYWSNTYATSQIIRALVDFSKTGSELAPNYSYTVLLDGNPIVSGRVASSNQKIKVVEIPVTDLYPEGSNVQIATEGEGQIYSTLLIDEFHTDKNLKGVDRGIYVKREYLNEKGEQYVTMGVGDTVVVKITVGGLNTDEYYAVIQDELPSGLVPINESFKNEQYGQNASDYYSSYDVTDREITQNGIVMSLYRIAPGERSYTYRARVVSKGTFVAPPAIASLMYAPEISGRSDVQTIKVADESEVIPRPETIPTKKRFVLTIYPSRILVVLIVILGGLFILRKRGVTFSQVKERIRRLFKKDKDNPPTQNLHDTKGGNSENPPFIDLGG